MAGVETKDVRLFLVVSIAATTIAMPARATTYDVSVQDFAFTPSALVVDNGDTVRWSWIAGTHSVVDDATGSTICSLRSAPSLPCTLAIPPSGLFALRYHCEVHPGAMKGIITNDPPPTITMTSPVNGETVTNLLTARGTAGDDTAVPSVVVEWQSLPIPLFAGTQAAICSGCDRGDGTWAADLLLLPGRYTIQVTATDDEGLATRTPPITITVI